MVELHPGKGVEASEVRAVQRWSLTSGMTVTPTRARIAAIQPAAHVRRKFVEIHRSQGFCILARSVDGFGRVEWRQLSRPPGGAGIRGNQCLLFSQSSPSTSSANPRPCCRHFPSASTKPSNRSRPLARCPLKATAGDAGFAVHCACGHNPRKILAYPRALLSLLLTALLTALGCPEPDHGGRAAA